MAELPRRAWELKNLPHPHHAPRGNASPGAPASREHTLKWFLVMIFNTINFKDFHI